MTEFHLMRPEWLWSLVPALALMLLLWRQRGRSGSWSDVIAPELLSHLVGDKTGPRSANLLPILFVGWVVAALAASGPSWQKIPQPIHQKQDALVLALDLSYSMKSGDIVPSRLDRARQKLLDLLAQRREGQTGLIAYAGDAHIVTPLTDDTATIANLLPALHPDMMPVPGSDSAAAVAQAVELLHSAGIRQGKILLVTDGITDKGRKEITKALEGSGAHLAIMGVGTATGAPIPLPRGGFLKDEAGTIVMPSLDEKNLRDTATASGGQYRRLQVDDSDLDYLLTETTLADSETTLALALDRTADTWDDQGYWFILLLLPLVLGLFRRGWVLCLLPLLLVAQPQPAHAQSWDDLWLTPDQQGQRALQQGDNEAASTLFENQDWAGTAAYRGGDYEAASGHFADPDNADGWYNSGNALARSGKLDEAITAYKESLALEPNQVDARENLALLEQLKEQQEQQQEQQDQNQKNEDQDQDQQQEQEQEQNQDQQQQGDQQQSDQESEQDKNQQQQQDENQEQQEDDSQSDNEQQEGDQEQQQPDAPQDEPGKDEQEQQAQATLADPQEQERDQAMEQWLRRVPDDPSGLLREKFRYESHQRQEQRKGKNDEIYW